MSLIDLQRDIHAWLTASDPAAAGRFGPAAVAGLDIYRNTYRAQLVACLESGFQRTRDWIGGEAFHRAVVTHIDRLPPSSWTLDAYGRDFPATLAMLLPDAPEVAELAWLEQALDEAFVAPDGAALTAADLTEVDWDRAVLRLTPTLDMADATTNAFAIWSALVDGLIAPPAERLAEPGAVIVWRVAEIARARPVGRGECTALLAIRSGLPFRDFCATIAEDLGETAGIALAGQWVGTWLSGGLVAAVEQLPPA